MDNFIKEFWENQAINHTTSHAASWGDNFAIDLEINTIGEYIKEGDLVLDMGCANGFAALRHLENRKPSKIYGVDYAPSMIKYANKVKNESAEKDKLDFEVGDILNIKFDDDTFDVVYTTRVIINLPNWKEQLRAIEECIRVAKPGGTVVFSEAFYEPLVLLNAMRALKQLPPLVEHDFNRYIKKDRLEKYLSDKNLEFECNEFSSVYYLGSRFLRELVTNPSDYPGYSNPINELFYDIEKNYSGGGFGIQQAYIIKK
ncbi:MAG TPA: class I SAM-dependent methyltransferase [Chitinophagales bacterium]|jgi:ubiquinone/menaquinone biosynthesis C-methylase UbiE|nr:class I SAM-dependent methyltransferase [Chitinophagales bacterium]HPH87701.1 class I SAM-dependent methyltransferase [Chitinophagales bacterium]